MVIVSIVVLSTNYFYCVLISSYDGLYQPMYLRPIYWALVLQGLTVHNFIHLQTLNVNTLQPRQFLQAELLQEYILPLK